MEARSSVLSIIKVSDHITLLQSKLLARASMNPTQDPLNIWGGIFKKSLKLYYHEAILTSSSLEEQRTTTRGATWFG